MHHNLNHTQGSFGEGLAVSLMASTSYMTTTTGVEDMTTKGPSLKEEAQQYLAYQVGMAVNKYATPLIAVVGIFGNILAFTVMLQRHNRHLPCCIYLAGLAISDTMTLLAGFYLWIVTVVIPRTSRRECQVIALFFQSGATSSTFTIVAVTLDRFLATCLPVRSMAWRTWRRALLSEVAIFAVSFVFNIPFMLNANFVNDTTCTGFSNTKQVAIEVYAVASTVLFSVVPFISILTMNIAIIRKIGKLERARNSRMAVNRLATAARLQNGVMVSASVNTAAAAIDDSSSSDRRFTSSTETQSASPSSEPVIFTIGGTEEAIPVDPDSNLTCLQSSSLPDKTGSRTEQEEKEAAGVGDVVNVQRASSLLEGGPRGSIDSLRSIGKNSESLTDLSEPVLLQAVKLTDVEQPAEDTSRRRRRTISPQCGCEGRFHRPDCRRTQQSLDGLRTDGAITRPDSSLLRPSSLTRFNSMAVKLKTGLLSRLRSRSNSDGRRLDKQLSHTLLAVSFTFLALTLPQYIRYTVYVFIDPTHSPSYYAMYVCAYHLTQKLFMVNDTMNFILYSVCSTRFRGDIKKLLCKCKRETEQTPTQNGGGS